MAAVETEKSAPSARAHPVRTQPFPPWPSFGEEEIEAAQCVLRSGRVSYWTGDEGKQFEREFAAFAGCEYGVALANGTVAPFCALWASGRETT